MGSDSLELKLRWLLRWGSTHRPQLEECLFLRKSLAPVFTFLNKNQIAPEHFPNAIPSGWDKEQALSTRVRTVHSENTGRRHRRGES